MLLPAGPVPHGGWPVVAWAHGTSGLADRCAPSLAADLAHDTSAVREVRALLAHHWAVVASDYPGLGTPGQHPYLIGDADGEAVADAVTASHQLLSPTLSRRWVTVGHSEGGQTALFVAALASRRAPQWDYRGTVALAPASTLEALLPLAESTQDPVEQAYLIYAVAGLSTVDPQVRLERLLSSEARAVVSDPTTSCIDDITRKLTDRPVDHVLDADPATASRLEAELGRYDDPDHHIARRPILVAQGTDDHDVPEGATTALVSSLCARGDLLDYRRYPGRDHAGVVTASLPAVTTWIASRFAGCAAPDTCPASP